MQIRPLLEEQPTGPVCIYELVTIGPASKRIQVAFHWWTDGGPRLYNGAETDQLFDNWHFNSTYYALHLEVKWYMYIVRGYVRKYNIHTDDQS